MSTTTRQTRSTLTSDNLIWHLVEEANTIKLKASVNKSHAALAAAHRKSNKGSSENGKGKDKKGKGKRSGHKCTNCKLNGHTNDNCFAKEGGKEHEALDWWKLKQEAKSKEPKKETANVATASSLKRDNHAYVTVSPTDFVPIDDEDFASLIITSGHNHKAYGVSSSTDLIVNCSTSSHFSPDKFKFVNFEAISPELI